MCYTTQFIDIERKSHDTDGAIRAMVAVPAHSIWFDGHFPGVAVLPGVAQLAIIVQILGKALGKPLRVLEVNRVRFKQVIVPAEPIMVQITPKERAFRSYGFRLMKGGDLACSGFLKVAENDSESEKDIEKGSGLEWQEI